MSNAEGDRDREGASPTDLADDVNAAIVKLYQFLDQGETDPGALDRAPACALHPVETLKQMRQLFGGYTRVTSAQRPSEDGLAAMPISPSNVNLKAFEMRLSTTFSHMSAST